MIIKYYIYDLVNKESSVLQGKKKKLKNTGSKFGNNSTRFFVLQKNKKNTIK